MENDNEINLKIIAITNKIKMYNPELLNFLNEMPITIPDEKIPIINNTILQEYYDSLYALLKKYEDEHKE